MTDPGYSLNQSSAHVQAQYSHRAEPRRAPHPAKPVWTEPVPRSSALAIALGIVGIVIVALVGLLVLGYLVLGIGAGAVVLCGLLALVPLGGVLLAVRWVDSWEPEPRGALWFAFLWGAAASVAIALLFDFVFRMTLVATDTTAPLGEFGALAVQAPIVEEVAKGFGLLLIYFAARRHFDGPVDGIVYAATIAAGFAFTENILYFGQALTETGPAGLATVFFLRAILSPFAHVMFTCCIGIALGWGAHRLGVGGAVGAWLLGLLPAIFLHALWNGGSYLIPDFLAFYVLLQVPLFLVAIAITVLLRRQEMRITRERLAEYAAGGWFSPAEVEMLATPAGRRRARAWAAGRGESVSRAMRRFTVDATRLAHARQRVLTDRESIGKQRDERQLLEAVVADRFALLHPGTA